VGNVGDDVTSSGRPFHVRAAATLAVARQSLTIQRLMSSLVCHDLPTSVLYAVFRATVVAQLTNASPTWWEYTTSTDRDRLEALSSETWTPGQSQHQSRSRRFARRLKKSYYTLTTPPRTTITLPECQIKTF